MSRQVGPFKIWILIATFLSFSICLPLGHVCLHEAGQFRAQTALNSQPHWQIQSSGENHEHDICQACLLAQNLILDRGTVGLTAIGTAESVLDQTYHAIPATTDHFQSASNRAPPTNL